MRPFLSIAVVEVVTVSPSRWVRPRRRGRVLEVVTSSGEERYGVRWSDGHERAWPRMRGARTEERGAAFCSARVRRLRRGDDVRDADASGGVPDPMGKVDVKPFRQISREGGDDDLVIVTALPLALERCHRVRVADHARDLDPAGLQVLLRRPQSPPRRLCAPVWVLDLPECGGEDGHRNRALGVAGEELLVQLGGIRRPVGKDEHARRRVHAAGLYAAQRERDLPERWWMAPIKGTLGPARRLAVGDEGHQER